jgi:hypothetical protein
MSREVSSEEKSWREDEPTRVMPLTLPKMARSDVATAFVVILLLNLVWAVAIVLVVYATR